MLQEITGALVRILDRKPEHTHIVIQEIAEEDWVYEGLLTNEWKEKKAEV